MIEIRPVGPVWYGFGCGGDCEKDHPISRDQYSGMFMGLFAAHQLVPDAQVRARAASLLTSMLTYLIECNWNVPLPPDGQICTSFMGEFHQQLVFLRIGKSVNPSEFGARYDEVAAATEATWIPMWLSALDPLAKYFKFNLQHANIWPALLAENDPVLRDQYLHGYRILRRATAHHRNAYFNLVRILIEREGDRPGVARSPSVSDPALSLQDEIRRILEEWLARREKVRAPSGLPRNDVPDPAFQVSLWPRHVAIYKDLQGGGGTYQATYALPVDGRIGRGMDFLWQRSPFDVGMKSDRKRSDPPPTEAEIRAEGAGIHKYREGPGVDYLLAYWLSVYLGVLASPTLPSTRTGSRGELLESPS
jgi:hypothetical protein